MTHNRRSPAAHALCLVFAALTATCNQADNTTPTSPATEEPVRPTPAQQKPEKPAPSPTTTPIAAATEPPEPSTEQVQAQYSPALKYCLDTGDAANGVSVAMGACFSTELAAQDVRLNAAYRTAMDQRSAAARADLRTRQRAWIKQRDTDCEEVRVGGTIDLIEVPGCLLDATVSRRIILQSLAE